MSTKAQFIFWDSPFKKEYVFRDIYTADDIELRVTDLEYSMKFTFLAVN